MSEKKQDMKNELKVHPIEIPKRIIGTFFTEVKRRKLKLELVDVIGSEKLLVDLIYKKHQRIDAIKMIEQVDEYLFKMEQRKLEAI